MSKTLINIIQLEYEVILNNDIVISYLGFLFLFNIHQKFHMFYNSCEN